MKLLLAVLFVILTQAQSQPAPNYSNPGPNCGQSCGLWDPQTFNYLAGDEVYYEGYWYLAAWWVNALPGEDAAWKCVVPPKTQDLETTIIDRSEIDIISTIVDELAKVDEEGVLMFKVSEDPDVWRPSIMYRWSDMMVAVQQMADAGVAGRHFLTGSSEVENGHVYGLVNLAAFLAQSMQESIQYDVCDENNWEKVNGDKFSAATACGSLGKSYQDYTEGCPEFVRCEVDPNMEMKAWTNAQWPGAPPPHFCAPKSKVPDAPQWNWHWEQSDSCDCNKLDDHWTQYDDFDKYLEYVLGGGTCEDYYGQQLGHWENCEGGCPASSGRTDVEGCCWWGRGVIQTTGVCNYGNLNYYAGKGAADRGAAALFPELDFCKNPQSICHPDSPPEVKWVAGLFYWAESVQTFDEGGWKYTDYLYNWVNAGMNLGDVGLIDGASNIVNQGCATCHAHATEERRDNFEKVINKMREANLFEGIGTMNAQFDDETNCIYDCMSDVDNTQLRIAQCGTCEDPATTCYVPGWSLPCWAAQSVEACLDMDGLDCTNLPDPEDTTTTQTPSTTDADDTTTTQSTTSTTTASTTSTTSTTTTTERVNVGNCIPCTSADPGCTHPGQAAQGWCDGRCTSGVNDDLCVVEYCYCHGTDVMGCTDSSAKNYDAEANVDDDSCEYDVAGCTDSSASNFNVDATIDDGSCAYEPDMCDQCFKKAKKVLGCERVLELAENGIPSGMQQKIEQAGCTPCVDSVIADCATSSERRKL